MVESKSPLDGVSEREQRTMAALLRMSPEPQKGAPKAETTKGEAQRRRRRESEVTVVAHPAQGTIVRVDLFDGFRPPEMGKRRPAVVLSPGIPGRPLMCSIVPLSTSRPAVVLSHHMEISFNPPLPEPYPSPVVWLKGDIILTVAFHRLRLLFSRWENGQRIYDVRVLDAATFRRVQECVRCGIGLSLSTHNRNVP